MNSLLLAASAALHSPLRTPARVQPISVSRANGATHSHCIIDAPQIDRVDSHVLPKRTFWESWRVIESANSLERFGELAGTRTRDPMIKSYHVGDHWRLTMN
jgi:hypothetical protein